MVPQRGVVFNVKMLLTILKALPGILYYYSYFVLIANIYFSSGEPEPELAFIFQELAANDEYKQYLRIIARRLIKTYRISCFNPFLYSFLVVFINTTYLLLYKYIFFEVDEAEIKAVEFCRGLMQERVEMYGVEPYLKEQWIGVLVDIVSPPLFFFAPTSPSSPLFSLSPPSSLSSPAFCAITFF